MLSPAKALPLACLVVGEDTGTADGLRARLAEANVLSYRVVWFERDDTGSSIPPAIRRKPPHAWRPDLPTIAGWWSGRGHRGATRSAASAAL
jgi:4-alpha-glucanotransferase